METESVISASLPPRTRLGSTVLSHIGGLYLDMKEEYLLPSPRSCAVFGHQFFQNIIDIIIFFFIRWHSSLDMLQVTISSSSFYVWLLTYSQAQAIWKPYLYYCHKAEKKILYSIYMIEQLAHDICFVIILHIQNIPLVHRSDQESNMEWGGWREGRKLVKILSDHNLREHFIII